MDDEQKQLKAAERAARAQILLDDDMLKEAFAELEKTYMSAWRNTGTAENATHTREKLWLAVNLVGKVQEHLNLAIQNGKLAKAQLAQITRKNAA